MCINHLDFLWQMAGFLLLSLEWAIQIISLRLNFAKIDLYWLDLSIEQLFRCCQVINLLSSSRVSGLQISMQRVHIIQFRLEFKSKLHLILVAARVLHKLIL